MKLFIFVLLVNIFTVGCVGFLGHPECLDVMFLFIANDSSLEPLTTSSDSNGGPGSQHSSIVVLQS